MCSERWHVGRTHGFVRPSWRCWLCESCHRSQGRGGRHLLADQRQSCQHPCAQLLQGGHGLWWLAAGGQHAVNAQATPVVELLHAKARFALQYHGELLQEQFHGLQLGGHGLKAGGLRLGEGLRCLHES